MTYVRNNPSNAIDPTGEGEFGFIAFIIWTVIQGVEAYLISVNASGSGEVSPSPPVVPSAPTAPRPPAGAETTTAEGPGSDLGDKIAEALAAGRFGQAEELAEGLSQGGQGSQLQPLPEFLPLTREEAEALQRILEGKTDEELEQRLEDIDDEIALLDSLIPVWREIRDIAGGLGQLNPYTKPLKDLAERELRVATERKARLQFEGKLVRNILAIRNRRPIPFPESLPIEPASGGTP